MILKEKILKMKQTSPYQAESVYLYGKQWRKNLETGNALDINTMRHQNFERNIAVLRTSHNSLIDDVNELIAIWEKSRNSFRLFSNAVSLLLPLVAEYNPDICGSQCRMLIPHICLTCSFLCFGIFCSHSSTPLLSGTMW